MAKITSKSKQRAGRRATSRLYRVRFEGLESRQMLAGDLIVASSPNGVPLDVDGENVATPVSSEHETGAEVELTAPASICLAGFRHTFDGWSTGEAGESITYTVPEGESTVTANYVTGGACSPDDPTDGVDPGPGEDFAARNGNAWWVGVSNGLSSDDSEWGASAEVAQWADVRVADVDGNKLDDLVGRTPDGTLWTALSQEDSFSIESWGSWATDVDWQHVGVGDFNGDGLEEVVGFANGAWQVSGSTGSSFINETWAQWRETAMWEDLSVADVNGDGLDDVIGRNNGGWWVGRSNGIEFKTERWAKWSNTAVWEDVQFADVDGDLRDDVMGRTNGNWWVGVSTGLEFDTSMWGSWNKNAAWTDVITGDFNGDGVHEIAGRANNKAWWISVSHGSSFTNEKWGEWDKTINWQDVQSADLNGDGRYDLLGRDANQVIAAISTGTGFFNTPWTELSDAGVWDSMVVGQFALSDDEIPGDFNGDGKVDADDIDILCAAIQMSSDDLRFDLTGDDLVNLDDYDYMIEEILGTTPGDADLNGIMDSEDLVQVFIEGKYETGQPAGWAAGDWNCDGVFDSDDLTAAFLANSFA